MNEPAPIRNEVSVAGFGSGVRGVRPPSSRDGRKGVFLTDLIVELGFADRTKIEQAEEASRTSDKTIEQLLLDTGTVDESQLSLALAERHGLDHVDLTEFEVDMKAAECVSRSVAARSRAVPIAFASDGALIAAVQDIFDALGVRRLETTTGREVRPVVATPTAIRQLIERLPDEPIESGFAESPEEPSPEEPSPEEPSPEQPKGDTRSSFDGLSMDLGPMSMEPSEPEPAAATDSGDVDEAGGTEGRHARELRRTKEDVAKLEARLKEAFTAAEDAIAAKEKLSALRSAIDDEDS
jgi:MshEN domain